MRYGKKVDEHLRFTDQAFQWVRTLPEYQKDLKQQQTSLKRIKLQKNKILANREDTRLKHETEAKWGFFPLDDAFSFQGIFQTFYGEFFLDRAVKLKNVKFMNLLFNTAEGRLIFLNDVSDHQKILPPRLHKLLIEVDPEKPITEITEELRWRLKVFQEIYRIKNKRPRVDDLLLRYKRFVYEKLGKSKSQIKKLLFPEISHPDRGESFRKKAERILKK